MCVCRHVSSLESCQNNVDILSRRFTRPPENRYFLGFLTFFMCDSVLDCSSLSDNEEFQDASDQQNVLLDVLNVSQQGTAPTPPHLVVKAAQKSV